MLAILIFLVPSLAWSQDLATTLRPPKGAKVVEVVPQANMPSLLSVTVNGPASGTLPPPVGLHGTLAQWLEMERKARSAVEDERNAFVERVGQFAQHMRRRHDDEFTEYIGGGGVIDPPRDRVREPVLLHVMRIVARSVGMPPG